LVINIFINKNRNAMNENKTWRSDMIKKLSDGLDDFMKTNGKEIKEKATEVINNIKEKFGPTYKALVEQLKLATQVVVIDEKIITMNAIIAAARNNMISGATEIVALKEVIEEEKMVWLTFSDKRELLPQEKNKYIVIRGESFDEEVEKLFENENLVILE